MRHLSYMKKTTILPGDFVMFLESPCYFQHQRRSYVQFVMIWRINIDVFDNLITFSQYDLPSCPVMKCIKV